MTRSTRTRRSNPSSTNSTTKSTTNSSTTTKKPSKLRTTQPMHHPPSDTDPSPSYSSSSETDQRASSPLQSDPPSYQEGQKDWKERAWDEALSNALASVEEGHPPLYHPKHRNGGQSMKKKAPKYERKRGVATAPVNPALETVKSASASAGVTSEDRDRDETESVCSWILDGDGDSMEGGEVDSGEVDSGEEEEDVEPGWEFIVSGDVLEVAAAAS